MAFETTTVDFNRVRIDAAVMDGVAVHNDATMGDVQVAATYLTPEYFPATVEDFIAYFERLSANDGPISLTLDEHGWYPATGRIDPLPDAEDDDFSWTLAVTPA